MIKIYVVVGDTGEYSDHHQWLVCAYMSEELAQARVIELETLMKTLGAVADAEWEERELAMDKMRKHEHGDQFFNIDYTGTTYSYIEIELKDYK